MRFALKCFVFCAFYFILQSSIRGLVKQKNEISTTKVLPPPESTIEHQLDVGQVAFIAALARACKSRQVQSKDQFWYWVRDGCKDETWKEAFGFLTFLCPRVACKSCDQVGKIDMDKVCAAYHGYERSLARLRSEVIFDPLKPKVNSNLVKKTDVDSYLKLMITNMMTKNIISFGFGSLLAISIAYKILIACGIIEDLLINRANPSSQ